MITPDHTIICKSVDRPLANGCEVGGIVTIIRPTDDGSCTMPAKITSITERAEIIAVVPIGTPQRIQRREFARLRSDTGVQLRLEFDSNNSRYKGIKVFDIGGGGLGVTIYSKLPIETGQRATIEIELSTSKNKIVARGEVVHCNLRDPGAREYLLGFKFVKIGEFDQRMIVDYVKQEQQKQLEQDKTKEAEEQQFDQEKTEEAEEQQVIA